MWMNRSVGLVLYHTVLDTGKVVRSWWVERFRAKRLKNRHKRMLACHLKRVKIKFRHWNRKPVVVRTAFNLFAPASVRCSWKEWGTQLLTAAVSASNTPLDYGVSFHRGSWRLDPGDPAKRCWINWPSYDFSWILLLRKKTEAMEKTRFGFMAGLDRWIGRSYLYFIDRAGHLHHCWFQWQSASIWL